MLDVIYIAASIAFFALMLVFVRGLESLGRDPALQDSALQDPALQDTALQDPAAQHAEQR